MPKTLKSYTLILEGTQGNTQIKIKESEMFDGKYAVVVGKLASFTVEEADVIMQLSNKANSINNICKAIQKGFGKKIVDIQ